jgi:hypothetical protein
MGLTTPNINTLGQLVNFIVGQNEHFRTIRKDMRRDRELHREVDRC